MRLLTIAFLVLSFNAAASEAWKADSNGKYECVRTDGKPVHYSRCLKIKRPWYGFYRVNESSAKVEVGCYRFTNFGAPIKGTLTRPRLCLNGQRPTFDLERTENPRYVECRMQDPTGFPIKLPHRGRVAYQNCVKKTQEIWKRKYIEEIATQLCVLTTEDGHIVKGAVDSAGANCNRDVLGKRESQKQFQGFGGSKSEDAFFVNVN